MLYCKESVDRAECGPCSTLWLLDHTLSIQKNSVAAKIALCNMAIMSNQMFRSVEKVCGPARGLNFEKLRNCPFI
jgi:hypothetical protein